MSLIFYERHTIVNMPGVCALDSATGEKRFSTVENGNVEGVRGGRGMRGATVIMEHLLPTGRDTCGDVSIFIHRAIIDGLWPKKY